VITFQENLKRKAMVIFRIKMKSRPYLEVGTSSDKRLKITGFTCLPEDGKLLIPRSPPSGPRGRLLSMQREQQNRSQLDASSAHSIAPG
jgi:hypothetical protein